MKIIISHDVDHLFLKEHFSDTFLLGNFYRGSRNLIRGNISLASFFKRFSGRLNRIKELHEFNKKAGIRETFFFGMRKGLNLSYHWKATKPFIDYLVSENVLLGMHGMAFDFYELLQEEMTRMKSLLPENYPLGIRNHYLRMNDNTLGLMEKTGFAYDSTLYKLAPPSLHGKMWEIPISIMDAGFVSNYKNNPQDLQQRTISIINDAEKNSQLFFVVNFHDLYFSNAYQDHKQWYEWLIGYFSEKNYEFINFEQAIKILNT